MTGILPDWLRKQVAADMRRRADESERLGEAIGFGFGRREGIEECRSIADVLDPPVITDTGEAAP